MEKNLLSAVRDTLRDEMAQDDRIIILGEDVGSGAFKANEGLRERFGEARVIDTPLAESSIVGVAIGAGLNGMLPVVEIQFADFIHAAIDQIISEAAKMRYRSNNDFHCPIVIRAPYGGGLGVGPYHSQCVEALFFSTPGLKIAVPATPYDTKGMLRAAIHDPDPVLFFEHKVTYRGITGEVPDEPYVVPLGQAEVKREGDDITVITYGMMLHHALEAAGELSRSEGIECHVLDLRSLLPLDREAIVAAARKTGKVLVAHEDNLTGGVGGEIAALVADKAFWYLDAPVRRVAAPDIPSMPYHPKLEGHAIPTVQKLKEAIAELAQV